MGRLSQKIKSAVARGRYVVGVHAGNQLDDRGIADWQVVAGLAQGELLCERPRAIPNPAIEVEERLADGTRIKAVWSWLRRLRAAKLVTVHYFNR